MTDLSELGTSRRSLDQPAPADEGVPARNLQRDSIERAPPALFSKKLGGGDASECSISRPSGCALQHLAILSSQSRTSDQAYPTTTQFHYLTLTQQRGYENTVLCVEYYTTQMNQLKGAHSFVTTTRR
jgi:hypothetical protein